MTSSEPHVHINKLQPAELKHVHIQDNFFDRYTKLVQSAILPYQWDALNDNLPNTTPSHSIKNFRIAAGLEEGTFNGCVFQDSDAAKWLEAVGFSLAHEPNAELEAQADSLIELIGQAQEDDGYLNTFFQLKAPQSKWKNLTDCHELYVAGHFIEAAVAYYHGTGKTALLDIVNRFVDLIDSVFGPGEGQIKGYPGHEEIELALIKLYQVSGNERHLALAKYFIDERGQSPNYFDQERASDDFYDLYGNKNEKATLGYHQADKPVREQTVAQGHAVRAVYLYSGMVDVAAETDDQELLDAADGLYRNIVEKQMYITGGIGQSCHLERFTVDYDLQNDANYSETCASIGLALFALRLGQVKREGHYHDTVERALYNNTLSGIQQDGKSFFYVNPMEVWPDNLIPDTARAAVKHIRRPWFGCACCPPNVARTLASLGQYIYGTDENTIYIQQFIANRSTLQVGDDTVEIEIKGEYPWKNQLSVEVTSEKALKLAIRKPAWSNYLKVDGVDAEADKGFVYIDVASGTTVLAIELDIRPRFNLANPAVRADRGLIALTYGPLTYCIEEVDNRSNLKAYVVDTKAALAADGIKAVKRNDLGDHIAFEVPAYYESFPEWQEDALYRSLEEGEATVNLEPTTLTFIAYPYWANRTPGEMNVWVRHN